jgi:ethanolaminephosphotransferase
LRYIAKSESNRLTQSPQTKRHRFRSKAGTGLSDGFSSLVVAALFGISRRWNQTGQKYAGDPDISSRVLPAYTWLLWLLVIATYVLITVRISRQATRVTASKQMSLLSVMVCITSFTFKVAFTAADAPELLQGVDILNPLVVSTSSLSLVAQARIVFVGIAQLLAYTVYYHSPWNHKADRTGTLPIFYLSIGG